MVSNHCCPDCDVPFDFLDSIYKWVGPGRREPWYQLWICHNEECESYGCIWNDHAGGLAAGDPSGIY